MLNSVILSVNNVVYGALSKVPIIGGLFEHTINAPANVKAFLMVVRSHESSLEDKAYRMVFGGKLINDLSDHPCNTGEWTGGVYNNRRATPAGAYQATISTWNEFKKKLNLPDFSRASQDKFAIGLLKERGAYDMLISGNFRQACKLMAFRWASLPDSDSGQPKQTYSQALETYKKYGGVIS